MERQLPGTQFSGAPIGAAGACARAEWACAYALQAVPCDELGLVEAHFASCSLCRDELAMLRPVVDRLIFWPTALLRPPWSLQQRLARRISEGTCKPAVPPPAPQWSGPDWKQVASGIECKLLATDTARQRVSMLVRLAPNASYPAHIHAGIEELYLLDGELWIDDRKLFAGGYSSRTPGSADDRVWSKTGCTCLLVTSTTDILR